MQKQKASGARKISDVIGLLAIAAGVLFLIWGVVEGPKWQAHFEDRRAQSALARLPAIHNH